MSKRIISIAIPTFNSENHIKKTIEDFIRVFPEAEFLIVDDNSEDNTWEALKMLNKTYPHNLGIIRLNKNLGQHPALFIAIFLASGEYIITTDDDHVIGSGEFLAAFNKIKNSGSDFIYLSFDKKHDGTGARIFNLLFNKVFGLQHNASNHKILKSPAIEKIKPCFSEYLFIDNILLSRKHTFEHHLVSAGISRGVKSRLSFFAKVIFFFRFIIHYFIFNIQVKYPDNQIGATEKKVKSLIKEYIPACPI